MDWKTLGKLWLVGLALVIAGSFLIGCSEQRWHPTDPRLETQDPTNVQVVERWEIGVNVEAE